MEEEQTLQFTRDQSNIFHRRKNFNDFARNKFKNNKEDYTLVKVIAAVLICLIIAGIAIKVFMPHKNTSVKSEQIQQLHSIPSSSQLAKIQDLQKQIKILSQSIQDMKRQLNKPKPPEIISGNSSSKQLINYFQQKFNQHKITINFLHAHDRQVYFYNKIDFLKSVLGSAIFLQFPKAKTSFLQAISNFKLPHSNIHIQQQTKRYHNQQFERLGKQYDFKLPELPFCIVVPSLNNAKNFRYQYNLQSMVNLDYKNFKIVIIDDASTDFTAELIQQWIQQNDVQIKITVIKNEKRLTAVPNIHTAITKHCSPEDIVVLADGDDQILGRYSLKVFNHVYQKQKSDVVYSNHLQFYTASKQVFRGWSMSYSDQQKKNNRYRDVPQKIAHLRSFKAKLYLKIKQEDLKQKNGQWFTSTYDQVICLPILEMSCGRISYIQQFFYLYNFQIGTNDLQVDKGLQKRIADYVKFEKTKYTCLNE